MKQQCIILACLCILISFVNIHCEKTIKYEGPQRPPLTNTAPVVNAGRDMMIFAPNNQVLLSGYAEDRESNIARYSWRKVGGTASCSFTDSTQLVTQVTNLVKGYYAFELTVTDSLGLEGKATIRILVVEATTGQNEIIFHDLVWDCWWGCDITILNYAAAIPPNSTFAVFIQRDFSSNKWVLATNDWVQGYNYLWDISAGDLTIFGTDGPSDFFDDTPDVKIVY